jgi:uncharacterized membrane protein YjfL (UPF0719 family)
MDPVNIAIALGMGLLQLLVGLVLAIASIYIGLSLFGKFTKGMNEMEELKKGNAAVGILMAAIILAIANVVQSGVVGLTGALMSLTSLSNMSLFINAVIAGIIQLVVGIVFAVVAIYLAINVLDKITKEIDEVEELKKGNVAVAILMAGVLIAVSFVVQAGVSGLARAIGVSLM